MSTIKLLLKHGVESLVEHDENIFKENIIQSLALKLNETVKETKSLVTKNLLQRPSTTGATPELNEFLNFISNFKGGNYTFKNGSIINITESDIHELKKLFESLNAINRQTMVSEILIDGEKFKDHLTFSQKVKQFL